MVILQTQALSQASQKLDQAWMATQVTKGWILDALKPLCRFTSAFVTAAEIGQGDQNCFNAHPTQRDPQVFGINSKGLARITAGTHGFWLRRSQVARLDVAALARCRPATDAEVAKALDLTASKVDTNAGEDLTSQARALVIARCMPKQILADKRLKHMVDLKQFYMAMWVKLCGGFVVALCLRV